MNEDEKLADLLGDLARHGAVEAASSVEGAFRLACEAHKNQMRSNGAPYVTHPLRVALVLLNEWEVRDGDVLVAALLHDTVEDTAVSLQEIEDRFGERAKDLVDYLTKPEVQEGEEKAERTASYYARLGTGPKEARLIKMADRVDNLRDMLTARWTEEKKRAYVSEALETILPLGEAEWPKPAETFKAVAAETLAAVERGEGDVPDVGPHDDVAVGIEDEDPVIRASSHLSFFRKDAEVFLFHDLVGDIIGLHEKVLGFIDYFQSPHKYSEARAAFASEFLDGDMDAFLETFAKHLVLLPQGIDDANVVADWHPLRGPWIVSHMGKDGRVSLCYKDRREGVIGVETLGRFEGRLFQMCTGSLKVSEIVTRLEREFPKIEDHKDKVLGAIRRWTHSRCQLLKMIPRPKDAYEMVGLPPYAVSTMPYALLRHSAELTETEPTRDYHKLDITSADDQFDVKETTLSHAFRIPHPALGGRTYGAALARSLVERDVLPDAPSSTFRAAEVGGGTGFFAKAFLDGLALRAPRLFNRLRYSIVDLSPALRASQRERTAVHSDKISLVGGDAEALPFADASLDFIVSNEVIADLRVSPVRRQDVTTDEGGPGAEAVRKYDLAWDHAPGLFFVNLGAFHFVEECARVLKPGGTAVMTEYGSHSEFPEQSTHLDHAEFSIQFGHLKQVAAKLNLETSLEYLPALLNLDESVKVLETTQSFFETLRAFLRSREIRLEKLAYTEDMFAELLGNKLSLRELQGLKFTPCGQRVLGLKPKEFKALIIRKPLGTRKEVKKIALDL